MSSIILIYSLVLANSEQVSVFDIELKFPPAKFMTGVASGKSICRFFLSRIPSITIPGNFSVHASLSSSTYVPTVPVIPRQLPSSYGSRICHRKHQILSVWGFLDTRPSKLTTS